MAAPTAQYNVLDTSLFDGGDNLFAEDIEEQLLENLQLLLLEHDHDGSVGNGGALALANPLGLMFYGAAASS